MAYDVNLAIDHLGLNANFYKLDQNIYPNTITYWDSNNSDAQPSESALQTAYDEAVVVWAWKDLRYERDQRLAETDHFALGDVTMSSEMTAYRQALRDLPANTSDPSNPTWPTKPS